MFLVAVWPISELVEPFSGKAVVLGEALHHGSSDGDLPVDHSGFPIPLC